jgi:hypothetical protein
MCKGTGPLGTVGSGGRRFEVVRGDENVVEFESAVQKGTALL